MRESVHKWFTLSVLESLQLVYRSTGLGHEETPLLSLFRAGFFSRPDFR